MKKVLSLVAILLFVGSFTFCFKKNYHFEGSPGKLAREGTHMFFVFGLVPTSDINVEGICENGVAQIRTYRSFIYGLVGMITYGLITPENYEIYCK